MSTPIHDPANTEKTDNPSSPDDNSQQTQKAETTGSTLSWVITLFGTAVGAGILFLPLNAGSFGFWPLVFATVFIFRT
jgi:HAAAP family hydroxy/aromatic amino acid permease